ncbi:MAG: Apolipoprotein N-acyltransferase-like protein [Pedosphaera sp.]|nr:Apolipoprotein N-acyltransferase-like protein [Pedosphaera sp.]
MSVENKNSNSGLTGKAMLLLSLAAVVAFQLAYTFSAGSFLIIVYLYCLFELTRLKSGRWTFYIGLTVGFLAYAPQLHFFWTLFGPSAIALWLLLAFWLALFLALARLCRLHLGKVSAALMIPFVWTGLEYFRSELYYLRFSWLNVGYAFSPALHSLPLKQLGVYGIGFALLAAICLLSLLTQRKRAIAGFTLLASCAFLVNFPATTNPTATTHSTNSLAVAGMQLEFPSEAEVLYNLNKLIKSHPDAQLLVLSEYTFDSPVPDKIKIWCRQHQRYLIVGAKDPASASADYYNTAFVIGPTGDILFRQAKSVPIQFFKDGLPAREQKLWQSPWGRIGICICYDLSYSRVTDELVRLGAQAMIVPTMDVAIWGRHQHELHARVAPMRAAEYGIPIFRLASSGISQHVSATGESLATAPFPGDAAMLAGVLDLNQAGRLPWDRVLAPVAVCVTGLLILWLVSVSIRNKFHPTKQPD